MTNIFELFSGIGVVIDEAIFAKESKPNGIQKIVNSIKKQNIPVLEYENLPDDNEIPKLHSISFLILDWNLSGIHPIPEATIKDNIDFIKTLHNTCFIPLFIFSDEDTHTIEVQLSEHNIAIKNAPIFIKNKDDLKTAKKLSNEIANWVKRTPSIFVLKEWEKATRTAKTQMLYDLSSIHPSWPSVLKKSIEKDGGDSNWNLMNSLQSNLSYRIVFPEFDDMIINSKKRGITKEEIRRILECERFIPNNKLPDYPFAGDIYEIEKGYYVNIRPDCDIIREKKDLYLLKGTIIEECKINSKSKQKKDRIVFVNGEFQEKINNCYIAFINGKILCFCLRKLTIKKWTEIKSHRVGRILPPFITKIQQKYSSYIQRQGLPSIPIEAIK